MTTIKYNITFANKIKKNTLGSVCTLFIYRAIKRLNEDLNSDNNYMYQHVCKTSHHGVLSCKTLISVPSYPVNFIG